MEQTYRAHIAELQARTRTVLERHQLRGLLIHSGEPIYAFLDDNTYPFRVNPHFKAWVPVTNVTHSWLLVDGDNKPQLFFYAPVDYWHSVEPLPTAFWTEEVELIALRQPEDILQYLPQERSHLAYIGASEQKAADMGIGHINPTAILNFFHYQRAFKTDYELCCMREAQKIAVTGHRAAYDAFMANMSEFDINLAYLAATGQSDSDVPYNNIVALNQNSAVLHYTSLAQKTPARSDSFLLDAGASYNGYAADITRTYAREQNDFAALISDMHEQQQALIASIQPGMHYIDLHIQMHQRIAGMLRQHDIVRMSEDAMMAEGVTRPFLPHGLGHFLGLQVHDVAGFMQDEQGTHLAAPVEYPALRCTRLLEPRMVLTIEPGLYFIDSLLEPWKQHPLAANFNWAKIDQLRPFGGIRIEDNIVITEHGVENLTRDLALN
ncbi:MAG: Xaa-Pro dipeptidase [Plesiomonas sp.]|uniref:Xaa-Pro dipeptidase n=1 Tax=Plesiomonas sp. TaxID=2486279 RepID=UPI003F3F22D2